MLRDRFFSFTMVMGVAFLLLVSLVLSAALSAMGAFFSNLLPGGEVLWQFWVYYAAQILLVGAEFTQVYAHRSGTRVTPSANAVGVTETAQPQPNAARSPLAATPARGATVAP